LEISGRVCTLRSLVLPGDFGPLMLGVFGRLSWPRLAPPESRSERRQSIEVRNGPTFRVQRWNAYMTGTGVEMSLDDAVVDGCLCSPRYHSVKPRFL